MTYEEERLIIEFLNWAEGKGLIICRDKYVSMLDKYQEGE